MQPPSNKLIIERYAKFVIIHSKIAEYFVFKPTKSRKVTPPI